MKYVPPAFEVETMSMDSLDRQAREKARRRREMIVKSASERDIYQFAPSESMSQDAPAYEIPDSD